ncbi:MAG TPA: zinc-binding dehydrogenase [Verrucomicrobiae bacterium]
MKAAVLYGKEDVRVEEVAPKPLQPGEVRIAIEAALTCGTDLKVYKRGYHARMIVPPAVFGHELSGTVCEVHSPRSTVPASGSQAQTSASGAGVAEWRVGERVVVANSAPCGDCFFCGNGQENLCDDLLFVNGAYAQSIVVPARVAAKNMLRLKSETPFADAALVEPLACVVQGIQDSRVRAGQRVLVIGSGPIGLMFVALARHLGCAVSVSGRGEQRLELARKLGAARIIDAASQAELPTPGSRDGYDVVIEAVGKPQTWEAAVRLVRKGGTVNFFGGCPSGTSVTLDTALLHYSNLSLLASFHHTPRSIREALGFIERGVIRAADFVDGECPLSELPALFQSMARGNRAIKTLVRVRA